MGKLVYLHELDSVRKSKKEIAAGQAALFEEIALNGNSVVITFHQLTDSHAFLAPLYRENDDRYKVIMELFRCGVLKISPFVYPDGQKCHTASQYMQRAMDKVREGKSFINSALPIKVRLKDAKAPVDANAKLDDLSEKLYAAIRFGDIKSLKEGSSDNSIDEKDRLFLVRFVELVHLLSTDDLARNPVKESSTKKFICYMNLVLCTKSRWVTDVQEIETLQSETCEILVKIKAALLSDKLNLRSEWHDQLKVLERANKAVWLAVTIVDLCYNYAVEESISSASKHYDDEKPATFWKDFCFRLKNSWKDWQNPEISEVFFATKYDAEKADSDLVEWIRKLPWWQSVRWKSVEWMMGGFRKREKKRQGQSQEQPNGKIETYEENFEKNKTRWQNSCRRWFWKYLGIMLFYVGTIIAICFAVDWMGVPGWISGLFWGTQEQVAGIQEQGLFPWLLSIFWAFLTVCTSFVFLGLISCAIYKCINKFRASPIPDILSCFGNVALALGGYFYIWWIFWWRKSGSAYNILNERKKNG